MNNHNKSNNMDTPRDEQLINNINNNSTEEVFDLNENEDTMNTISMKNDQEKLINYQDILAFPNQFQNTTTDSNSNEVSNKSADIALDMPNTSTHTNTDVNKLTMQPQLSPIQHHPTIMTTNGQPSTSKNIHNEMFHSPDRNKNSNNPFFDNIEGPQNKSNKDKQCKLLNVDNGGNMISNFFSNHNYPTHQISQKAHQTPTANHFLNSSSVISNNKSPQHKWGLGHTNRNGKCGSSNGKLEELQKNPRKVHKMENLTTKSKKVNWKK